MTNRKIFTAGLAAAALAAGAAGAVAATSDDEGAKREDAVLTDAAKRLGVEADKLKTALSAAQAAELDRAVTEGRLTREQAARIKADRAASGRVLGGPGPGHHRFGPGGRGGGPGGGPAALLGDAAKALGLSREQLFEKLRAGDTPAQIAKAQGKDLDDVKAAVRRAAVERLDTAVKAGRLTDAQRDAVVERLGRALERLGDRPLGRHRHHGDRGGRPPFGG